MINVNTAICCKVSIKIIQCRSVTGKPVIFTQPCQVLTAASSPTMIPEAAQSIAATTFAKLHNAKFKKITNLTVKPLTRRSTYMNKILILCKNYNCCPWEILVHFPGLEHRWVLAALLLGHGGMLPSHHPHNTPSKTTSIDTPKLPEPGGLS